MKRYELQVKRVILVSLTIDAESKEDALEKYINGDFTSEEEVTDSSDIEPPLIDEVVTDKSQEHESII